MRGRTGVQGEPVNPLLTLLALGIFANVLLLDLGAIMVDFSFFGLVAFWSMLAGLVAALPGTIAAVVSLLGAPGAASVRSVVTWRALADIVMVGMFTVVWLGRLAGERSGNGWYLAVEALAFVIGMAGAWVARRGVNRDRLYTLPASAGAGLGGLETVRLVRSSQVYAAEPVASEAPASAEETQVIFAKRIPLAVEDAGTPAGDDVHAAETPDNDEHVDGADESRPDVVEDQAAGEQEAQDQGTEDQRVDGRGSDPAEETVVISRTSRGSATRTSGVNRGAADKSTPATRTKTRSPAAV